MKDIIKEKLALYESDIVNSISELVNIPSVRNVDDKADGAPFGKDVRKALDYAISLGEKFGMRSYKSPTGHYGYLEVGDESLEEMVGIVGHLDVVPPGDLEQWKDDPFSGKVIDNVLYGRGSLDDKGPVVTSIYALKILMDLDFKFNKRVRIILGTAEETTWEGINEYIKNEEHPTIGFSPDAEFPGIYAERAIIQSDNTADETGVDFEVSALGAYNAVCDSVYYKGNKAVELKAELDKLGYSYKTEGDKVIVLGKGVHAMNPELGVNAILLLCEALYNIGENSTVTDFIAQKISGTTYAEKIFGNVEDDISGVLKCTIGRIEVKDGKGYFSIDSRIPILTEVKEIEDGYAKALKEFNIDFKIVKKQDKLYVEKDSFLVSTLLDVYKEITGEKDAEPLAIGGGTYARAFDNCMAYGALFVNQNQVDNMHQPNECLELKFLLPALEIYANAIYRLAK